MKTIADLDNFLSELSKQHHDGLITALEFSSSITSFTVENYKDFQLDQVRLELEKAGSNKVTENERLRIVVQCYEALANLVATS